MLKVYAIDGIVPVVHPDAYVHPSAVLIGDVIVAAGVYVGPCACLRGDFGRIVIEQGANIQDCCILHAFPDRDLVVELDGHIGHGAVLHGCVVKQNAMVGINSVVNDNAVVGESSIVGAMAFVKAGFELAWKREATRQYQALAARSLATMKEAVALTEVEAGRKRFRDASVMPL